MNLLVDSSCRAAHVTDMDTFYHEATDVFKWDSLENSTVMDIGCGHGLSSTKLLKKFPGIRKIIAIDKDIDIVMEARELFPNDKIEFQYGNIELGDGLHMYKNKVSTIFSTQCLCYLENQKAAFQNIYELLEDGGVAALLFFRKSLFRDFIVMTKNDPLFQSFLMRKESHHSQYSLNRYSLRQYEDILRKIGFRIERCEEVVKCREYATVEEYKEYILSTVYFKKKFALPKLYVFKKCLLDTYMTYYSEISDRNLPCFKEFYLQVFISKPPTKCDVCKLSLALENRLSIKSKSETPNQNSSKKKEHCCEDGNVRFHYR